MVKKEVWLHHKFPKWVTLGLIDQDGHGVNINKWRLDLMENQISHRGRAYENEINKINYPPNKIQRWFFK